MNDQKDIPPGGTGAGKNGKTLGEEASRLANSVSPTKGREFEELIAHELPLIPECDVKEAWRATDAPHEHKSKFWRGDSPNGIDVLALKRDGNYIAIQCKCYKTGTNVTSKDVMALAVSAQEQDVSHQGESGDTGVIDKLWMVATVDVAEATKNWKKDVTFINPIAVWGDHVLGREEKPDPHELDALQEAAFNDCIKHFIKREQPRGKLIMACGTGKTLVAQRVAEHQDITPGKGLVVYATPSILLTGQSQVSWLRNEVGRPIASIVVCSDAKAGAGGEKYKSEIAYDLLGSVTTTPGKIASEVNRLRKSLPENGIMVIFTTYQSMDKVIEAQRTHGMPAIDFAIADEAHWTAGKWSGVNGDREMSKYLMFHEELDAKRRMYQTATPRIYSQRSFEKFEASAMKIAGSFKHQKLVDMSAPEVFGETMHKLSFRSALKNQKSGQKRLCDYRIVIALDTSKETPAFALTGSATEEEKQQFLNTRDDARLKAIMESMVNVGGDETNYRNTGLRSCITFSNRVKRAEMFAKTVNDKRVQELMFGEHNVNLSAGHLDGTSTATVRRDELACLSDANDPERDKRHITFNVRVLSEGVDVPALDSVAFIDERDSEIDIVQAVGRVMRRPPGSDKSIGYVIVPVGMGKSVDCEKCMADSPFAEQWKIMGQVLRALRSHDPQIVTDYTNRMIVSSTGTGTSSPAVPSPFPENFIERLMSGALDGINPHIMPNSGVLRDDAQRERKSVMQRMVGFATVYLHNEGLGTQLMQCTGIEANAETEAAANVAAFRACQAAALHLTLCMLMQQRLVETRANQPPIAKLKSPRDSVVKSEIGHMLLGQWERVLEHDFKPIFGPGIAVLKALQSPNSGKFPKGAVVAMRHIAELATEHASKYVEIGADEAGEIFQAAMDKDTQKQFSANYTLPVAGVLLAEMTCDAYAPKTDPLWSDPQYWREHAILDPACGSGTLLVAMMSAIVRRARTQHADHTRILALRQALIEDALTGLDVNKWALQLAATQMAISVGSAPLQRMGLYDMPTKDDRGYPMLGSLELLLFKRDGSPRSLSETDLKSAATGLGEAKDVVDSHEGLLDRIKRVDICIANPPFGTFEEGQKKMSPLSKLAMKNRKEQVKSFFQFDTDKNPLEGASNSLSPWFTLLMTNTGCQIMGKVAPQIALVSPIPDERNYIRGHYDMVECATSHESEGKPSWSSESGITESILVFKRKKARKEGDEQIIPPPPPPPLKIHEHYQTPRCSKCRKPRQLEKSHIYRRSGSGLVAFQFLQQGHAHVGRGTYIGLPR